MKLVRECWFERLEHILPVLLSVLERCGCHIHLLCEDSGVLVKAFSKGLEAVVRLREYQVKDKVLSRYLGLVRAVRMEIELRGDRSRDFLEELTVATLRGGG